MVFSSITFLYYFLPPVFACYLLAPAKWKNGVLLAASLVFYAWGEPVYSLLMAVSVVQGYVFGLLTERAGTNSRSRLFLLLSLLYGLGTLAFFKYGAFFVSSVNALFFWKLPEKQIGLPIGISFYTFQILSYNIDVYRKRVPANRSLFALATYVTMFPQLIAGPIVRYADIDKELTNRTHSFSFIYSGIRRFLVGISKKVLLANQLGLFLERFQEAREKPVLFCWLYGVAFTLQIYYDFSGYSDMAVGLGRIFGFHFLENFDFPYMSRSIAEFWRRWHISLGSWFRDYVYLPLGGNRVSPARQIRNLLAVWALTGLWHGAAWNFVLWGLWYGVLLILEKYVFRQVIARLPKVLSHIYVMFFVITGFVLFNGDGLKGAFADLLHLFGLGNEGKVKFISLETIYYLKSYGVIFLVGAVLSLPGPWKILRRIFQEMKWLAVLEPVILSLLLFVVTGFLVDGSFNPFLYFRF